MAQLRSDGRSRQKPYSTRERSSRQRQSCPLSPSRAANWKYSSMCQRLVMALTLKPKESRMSLSIARICSQEYAPPHTPQYCFSLGVLISSYLAATNSADMPKSWYRSRGTLRPRQYLSVMRTARQRECGLPQRCRCISTNHPTSSSRIPGEISTRQAMKSQGMQPQCSRAREWSCRSERQGWTSGRERSHWVEREGLWRLGRGRLGSEGRWGSWLVRSSPNILAELRVWTCRDSPFIV